MLRLPWRRRPGYSGEYRDSRRNPPHESCGCRRRCLKHSGSSDRTSACRDPGGHSARPLRLLLRSGRSLPAEIGANSARPLRRVRPSRGRNCNSRRRVAVRERQPQGPLARAADTRWRIRRHLREQLRDLRDRLRAPGPAIGQEPALELARRGELRLPPPRKVPLESGFFLIARLTLKNGQSQTSGILHQEGSSYHESPNLDAVDPQICKPRMGRGLAKARRCLICARLTKDLWLLYVFFIG